MQLDHVTIRTRDIAGTREFFRAVFGLEVGHRPAAVHGIPGCWMYAEGQALVHLIGSQGHGVDRAAEVEHPAELVLGHLLRDQLEDGRTLPGRHERHAEAVGGEVIDVDFLECPYDAQGRDSVERALRKNPMPYAGFESVFMRKVELILCYPEESCKP